MYVKLMLIKRSDTIVSETIGMNDETLQTKNKNRSKLIFNKYLVNETRYCTEHT